MALLRVIFRTRKQESSVFCASESAIPTVFMRRRNMLKIMAALASVLAITGCASTISALTHRPVVEDSIKDVASTVSLAADRRTVVVITKGDQSSKFCAEPPPDTATSLKTNLEAEMKAKLERAGIKADAEGKLRDETATTVTVIAERTAPLDAFRTGVYALCQYHLNGAIAKEDVTPLFIRLIDAFAASAPNTARPQLAPEPVNIARRASEPRE